MMALTFRDKPKEKKRERVAVGAGIPRYATGTLEPPTWEGLPPYMPPEPQQGTLPPPVQPPEPSGVFGPPMVGQPEGTRTIIDPDGTQRTVRFENNQWVTVPPPVVTQTTTESPMSPFTPGGDTRPIAQYGAPRTEENPTGLAGYVHTPLGAEMARNELGGQLARATIGGYTETPYVMINGKPVSWLNASRGYDDEGNPLRGGGLSIEKFEGGPDAFVIQGVENIRDPVTGAVSSRGRLGSEAFVVQPPPLAYVPRDVSWPSYVAPGDIFRVPGLDETAEAARMGDLAAINAQIMALNIARGAYPTADLGPTGIFRRPEDIQYVVGELETMTPEQRWAFFRTADGSAVLAALNANGYSVDASGMPQQGQLFGATSGFLIGLVSQLNGMSADERVAYLNANPNALQALVSGGYTVNPNTGRITPPAGMTIPVLPEAPESEDLPPGWERLPDGSISDGQGHIWRDGQWWNEDGTPYTTGVGEYGESVAPGGVPVGPPSGPSGKTIAKPGGVPPIAASGEPLDSRAPELTSSFTVKLANRLGADADRIQRFLVQWAPWEGSRARFNPLATTQPHDRATGNFNDHGVKNYADEDAGVEATYETLTNGFYPTLLHYLRTGEVLDQARLAAELRKWGTTGFASQVESGAVRFAHGGYTTAPVFMAGDAMHPNPAAGGAQPELILNPMRAPLYIADNEDTMEVIGDSVPRYATGTDYASWFSPDEWTNFFSSGVFNNILPSRRRATTQPIGPVTPTNPDQGTPTPPQDTGQTQPPPVTTPPSTPTEPTRPGWWDWLSGLFGRGGTGGGFQWPWELPGVPQPGGGTQPPPVTAPGGRQLAENTFGRFSTNPFDVTFPLLGSEQQYSLLYQQAIATGWRPDMKPPYPRGVMSPSDLAELYARRQLPGVSTFNARTGY